MLDFAAPEDSADAYLADGLADALAVRLTTVRRLTLVSRSDVRRLRQAESLRSAQIGRVLGAAWLVTGRAVRRDGRLVVTAELVRAATGRTEWSRQFRLPQADILAMADSAAPGIAAAVVGRLTGDEVQRLAIRPTRDPRAYELYLRTTPNLDVADMRAIQQSIGNLQGALAIDPSFGAALGRIAYFYSWAFNWGLSLPGIPADSLVGRGLALADRALAADSTSVDAWTARGFLLFMRVAPDYPGAVDALHRATSLDSSSAIARLQLGAVLRRLGDFGSAEAEYHAALAANPRFSMAIADLGFVALTLRRFPDAVRWYDSALVVLPRWNITNIAARAHALAGDTAAARRLSDQALADAPFASRAIALAVAAQVAAMRGDTAGARALFGPVLAGLGDDSLGVREGFEFALGALAVGQRGRALTLIEHTRPRGAWLWSYLIMPMFDPLRAEPRFQRVLREATPPGAPRM